MKINIKKVEHKDLPKLFELYNQLIGEVGKYDNMCAVYDEIKDDPHYQLFGVYNADDELIATACLTRCPDMTGDARYYYNMENFVVDEQQRGRGVGRRLMEYLENYVKDNDGCYINFTSSMKRKEAHAFYRAMGYKDDYVKGFKKTFDAK